MYNNSHIVPMNRYTKLICSLIIEWHYIVTYKNSYFSIEDLDIHNNWFCISSYRIPSDTDDVCLDL